MEFEKTITIYIDIEELASRLIGHCLSDMLSEYLGIENDEFDYIDMNKVAKAVAKEMLKQLGS